MAETISSLDERLKIKANARLAADVLSAFPNQNVFDDTTLVDLRGMSTVDGKYRVSQLMQAIRGACLSANLSAYITKDMDDFIGKVEKLPREEKT